MSLGQFDNKIVSALHNIFFINYKMNLAENAQNNCSESCNSINIKFKLTFSETLRKMGGYCKQIYIKSCYHQFLQEILFYTPRQIPVVYRLSFQNIFVKINLRKESLKAVYKSC